MESLKDSAVDYVRRGLAVIALQPRKKAPAFVNGLKDATTHAGDVADWWDAYPTDNVAIVTGKVSGNIGVIDIDYDEDCGKDGFEYLRKWEREHGALPETWTVTTARGGQHLYYRFTGEVPRNTANEELAIDFRGEGGYVMAPPSVHPNGKTVEWDLHPDDYDLAYADQNVLDFIESIMPRGMGGGGERFELPESIGKGGRNQAIFKYAASLQSKGMQDAEVRILAHAANKARCNPPMPDDEVDRCVDSALGYDKGEATKRIVRVRNGKVELDTNKNGAPLQTCSNATLAIGNDPQLAGRFRFNELTNAVDVLLPLPWDDGTGHRPLTDSDYSQMLAHLETAYGLTKKQHVVDGITNVSMLNRFNPLTDWLNSLTWDGVPRMETLLSMFVGAEPNDYNASVMRISMLGAVARAFHPGTKFDYMPVLVGDQGLGKSTFLRLLACGDDWYSDNLNTIEGDRGMEKISGMWIVEMAELLAAKRTKDVEAIKAFITSTVDNYRKPYARLPEQRPRTCVFFGTTNSRSFLTDKTGNRRFLPIVCGVRKPVMDVFAKDAHAYVEQAWAEAVHVWRNEKPSLKLPRHIELMANEQQEDFTEDDPRVGMIENYLERKKQTFENVSYVAVRVCTQEIMTECLGFDQTSPNYKVVTHDVVAILDSVQGWKRCKGKQKTREYGVQRCWMPEEVGFCG